MSANSNISIDDMYIFCALINQGGFHAAARFLEMSEPAVSYRIKKIEESVQSVLIERGRNAVLTESGRVFFEYSKKAVADFEATNNKIQMLNKGLAGTLVVAVSTSVAKSLIPSICRKLQAERPNSEIRVLTCAVKDVCQKVLDKEVDLGFTGQNSLPSKDLCGIKIAQIEETIASQPMHPLANKKNITSEELSKYKYIMSAKQEDFEKIKSGIIKKYGIKIGTSNIQIEDFDMAKRYAKESDCLIIGPKYSFKDEFERGYLVPLSLENDKFYSTIRLIRRKDLVLTPLVKEFISTSIAVFKKALSY